MLLNPSFAAYAEGNFARDAVLAREADEICCASDAARGRFNVDVAHLIEQHNACMLLTCRKIHRACINSAAAHTCRRLAHRDTRCCGGIGITFTQLHKPPAADRRLMRFASGM